jgi:hypothetical protein
METRARLEAELVRTIEERPTAEIGVFVRTARPPEPADRQALEDAGLRIGTVVNTILTGRLRACDAVRVADLEFVRHIELAREIPRRPPPQVP